MKFIYIVMILSFITISSCSTGRYSMYNYNISNMRLNRERPRVQNSFSKYKMNKNIKSNREKPKIKY